MEKRRRKIDVLILKCGIDAFSHEQIEFPYLRHIFFVDLLTCFALAIVAKVALCDLVEAVRALPVSVLSLPGAATM